jgi:hypothetical protein
VPFKRFSKNLVGRGELPVARRKGQLSLLHETIKTACNQVGF